MSQKRNVLFSVTNFLSHDDEYLMLHRSKDRSVDAGRLNGIGGKLETGENFLDAAIRETKEETGYAITLQDIQLSGIVTLHGGYPDDWVMCFFNIRVDTKIIPLGNEIPDGKLIWMRKDSVLTSGYELVDDLHYCWKYIVSGETFFATTEVGEDEKVKKINIRALPFWQSIDNSANCDNIRII